MKISDEDMELFKLIDLATNGNEKAKWEIIWRFHYLIFSNSKIEGRYNEKCQEYVEMTVFNSIEKFRTLREIKKLKKF